MKFAMFAAALMMTTPFAMGATAAQPTFEQVGSLRVWQTVDGTSDESVVTATSMGAGNRMALGWRCESGGLNVILTWNTYLIGDSDSSTVAVQHRFTPSPAVMTRWRLATNHKGGFMPARSVSEFTQEALEADKVVARVQDEDGQQITDSFDLDGFDLALRKMPCVEFDTQATSR